MVGILSKLRIGKDKDKKTDEKGKSNSTLTEPLSPVKNKRASIHSLLEGKFESISPIASQPPKLEESKEHLEKEREKEKERDKSKIPLLRATSRSKAHQQVSGASRRSDDVPQLTLNLNLGNGNGNGNGASGVREGAKKVRDLGIVFEAGAESVEVWDEKALGEKRLNPAEAARLMRVCASTINVRGVDTLGIMHPHWYSSSPANQRKIISLFLSSGGPSSSSASTPASPSSAASAFESEIEFPRSLHDVAAVFRWALRHVTLDGETFGRIGEGEPSGLFGWYDAFARAERDMNYPELAFSELLLPRVKQPHVELLMITTGVIESLAARSEFNGVSGSKLSMTFGHRLLTGNTVEGLDSWQAFYSQWERAGRALEHIFLARLRDEARKEPIPKRLAELIAGYPFLKYSTDDRFPRSRLSTRTFDALHIRITSEVPPGTKVPVERTYPLRIVENSLRAEDGDDVKRSSHFGLWEEIKATANRVGDNERTASEKDTKSNSNIQLSRILADESIRLLSLRDDSKHLGTPTITMFSQMSAPDSHKEYTPLERNGSAREGAHNGHGAPVSRGPSKATTTSSDEPTSPILSDWNLFSSTGFGEPVTSASLAATLLDSDIEKTEPPESENKRYLRKSRSPARTARDAHLTVVPPPISTKACKTASVSVVRLDEAFVEFWADALLDPVSDAWPAFAVCQLKADAITSAHGSGQGQPDGKVGWLIIEQAFVPPAPPPPAPSSTTALDDSTTPTRRPSSPKPSTKSDSTDRRQGATGRISSTFSVTRKRFNFFGGSISQASTPSPPPSSGNASESGKKVAGAVVRQRVGEMGEIIKEEVIPETNKSSPAEEHPSPVKPAEEKEKTDDETANETTAPAVAAVTVAATVATITHTFGGGDVTNGEAHQQNTSQEVVAPVPTAPSFTLEVSEEVKAPESTPASEPESVSRPEQAKVADTIVTPVPEVQAAQPTIEHKEDVAPSADATNEVHTEPVEPVSTTVADVEEVKPVPVEETSKVTDVSKESEEPSTASPVVDAPAVVEPMEEVKGVEGESSVNDNTISVDISPSGSIQSQVVPDPIPAPTPNPTEDRPSPVIETSSIVSDIPTSIPEEKEKVLADASAVVEDNPPPSTTTILAGAADSRFVEHVDSSPDGEVSETETVDDVVNAEVVGDESNFDEIETAQDGDVLVSEVDPDAEQPLETILEQSEVQGESTSASPVAEELEKEKAEEKKPEVEEESAPIKQEPEENKIEAEEAIETAMEDSKVEEVTEPITAEEYEPEEPVDEVPSPSQDQTGFDLEPEAAPVLPSAVETVLGDSTVTPMASSQEQEQELVETSVVPPSTDSHNGVDVAAVEEVKKSSEPELKTDPTLELTHTPEPQPSSIPMEAE